MSKSMAFLTLITGFFICLVSPFWESVIDNKIIPWFLDLFDRIKHRND